MHLINEVGYLEELGVSGIKGPTQFSNVFEQAGAHLLEGSLGHHLEDTAEVHVDFDWVTAFQARLCVRNK